jgi:hypothetical protein
MICSSVYPSGLSVLSFPRSFEDRIASDYSNLWIDFMVLLRQVGVRIATTTAIPSANVFTTPDDDTLLNSAFRFRKNGWYITFVNFLPSVSYQGWCKRKG